MVWSINSDQLVVLYMLVGTLQWWLFSYLKMASLWEAALSSMNCLFVKNFNIIQSRIECLWLVSFKAAIHKFWLQLPVSYCLGFRGLFIVNRHAWQSMCQWQFALYLSHVSYKVLFCFCQVLNSVTLNIDITQFVSCANLKPIDMAVRFLLMSTIFAGVANRTTFVRLVNTRNDLKQLALVPGEVDEPITGLPFTSTHLRSLYITLQNSLLKASLYQFLFFCHYWY